MDGGDESIDDATVRHALRAQARKVQLQSLAAALALTLVAMLPP